MECQGESLSLHRLRIFIMTRGGVLRLAIKIIHNNKIRSFITKREFMSLAIGAFAFHIRTLEKRVSTAKTNLFACCGISFACGRYRSSALECQGESEVGTTKRERGALLAVSHSFDSRRRPIETLCLLFILLIAIHSLASHATRLPSH